MKKALVMGLVIGLVVFAAFGVLAYQGSWFGPSAYGMYSGAGMDSMHDYMVPQVDPDVANYMNSMHQSCLYAVYD